MAKRLKDLRPVYVVGIGWHRYQNASETPYVALGLAAIREALADARVPWPDVETSYVATACLGMASGRAMLKHLGATGRPLIHVENASASGSAAFRQACIEIGAGLSDVALVVGVDKPGPVQRAFTKTGVPTLAEDAIVPVTHYALLTHEYLAKHKLKPEIVARVAVKNHNNGAKNPNAQKQQARTLDEVMNGRPISGTLTSLQCCPVGEGAAAVIVASEDGIKRLGIDAGRAIRVTASAAASERPSAAADADATLTKETILAALDEAQLSAQKLDVIEVHDAFAIEELLYVEAIGLCPDGHAPHFLEEGAFDIGGKWAVSPSGGLLAMGHPIGPTGVGQIAEITKQLRREAGPRQQPNARTGLAHLVGFGSVCYAHILQRP